MLDACFRTRQVQQQWLRRPRSCPWLSGDAWRRQAGASYQPLSTANLINDGEIGIDNETTLAVISTLSATEVVPSNTGPRQKRELSSICTDAWKGSSCSHQLNAFHRRLNRQAHPVRADPSIHDLLGRQPLRATFSSTQLFLHFSQCYR